MSEPLAKMKPRRAQVHDIIYLGIGVAMMTALLAVLILDQQRRMSALIEELHASSVESCKQRQAIVTKSNSTWNAFKAIDERNRFIDEDIRQARITVFNNALQEMPTCTHFKGDFTE